MPAQQALPNGEIWRNIVTEEKSKVATSLDDYRGNYKYNLLDENLRDFNAEVPIFAQWDNHEVMEDWWPGEAFDRRGYNTKVRSFSPRADVVPFMSSCRYGTARRNRAASTGKFPTVHCSICFLLDMRSYRGPNAHPTTQYLLGPLSPWLAQLPWLKRNSSVPPLGTIAGSA